MIVVCLCFDGYQGKMAKTMEAASIVLIIAAAVFFALLFPYASGLGVPSVWLDIGRKLLKIWY